MTFTLQRTLNEIQKRDLTNSIVIIDTTTNNAKHDRQNNKTSTNTHKLLQQIINTYTQTYKTPQNLIIMQTIPSLHQDIHPYNSAAYSICRQAGVRYAKTLVGESHLWSDGIHIAHRFRPLHVSSVATAILGVDPHVHFSFSGPPRGPYGPWLHPWGSNNRPIPSSRWPPPGLIGGRQQNYSRPSPDSFREAAAAPPLAIHRSINNSRGVGK